jgi:hypothetical protein
VVGRRRRDHVGPLVALHMRRQGGRRVVSPIADGALEWFPMVVGLQVYLEMVASREGTSTVLALVALVAGVQLDMSVSTALVLEGPITIIAGVDGVRVAERTIWAVLGAQLLVHGLGCCLYLVQWNGAGGVGCRWSSLLLFWSSSWPWWCGRVATDDGGGGRVDVLSAFAVR